MAREQALRPMVVQWFATHPGEIATKERIATDLGLEDRQIYKAIHDWVKSGAAIGITTVATGNAWRYDPGSTVNGAKPAPVNRPKVASAAPLAADAGTLFERVGADTKGCPIIKGEDGRLWRLVSL